jgi:hypothetical protein
MTCLFARAHCDAAPRTKHHAREPTQGVPTVKYTLPIASAVVLLAIVSCNDVERTLQPQSTISAAKGGGGGGGGGGGTLPAPPSSTPAPAPTGGTQSPPSPQVDGPAWFFSSSAGPFTANINFDSLQGLSVGGISVGATRNAIELVYNVSKKTALTITDITFVGANPGDFSIAAADLAAAPSIVLPANKGAIELLHVAFTPSGEGPRTATLQVTSAAGIAQIFLKGTGLPQRPVLAPFGPLDFITNSAPANLVIQNSGGETLVFNSITLGGANPNAFAIDVANNGFSNCFAGMLLAPKSLCFMEVGLAPGATPPADATLIFNTNDPVNPTLNVSLTFRP